MSTVLVLGGGPDAEREVSIKSATAIADALKASGRHQVRLEIIDRLTVDQLKAMSADVIFPYLHGPWGEGGPLQDIVEADGRPFVGSGANASRLAMDKVSSKMIASMLQVTTTPLFVLSSTSDAPPFPLPVVVKPVHEGSTVGLHICRDAAAWQTAMSTIAGERAKGVHRAYMIEPKIGGQAWARELTVGVLDNQALPIIEIKPKDGLYDYQAKYQRSDTQYILDPILPPGVAERISAGAVKLAAAMRCRHVARVDFMLDPASGLPMFLEINTTPGFTNHSLVPKAAKHLGMSMSSLCDKLVDLALRDGPTKK
ncbi:MAG: D-alanine--D-alanine ligase [Phycisphaerales bacterium]|jgi:D-alanine-D-alanine ligase|nr:D-alanine--D-alanine ligase [Phycisphaerales bacterium]